MFTDRELMETLNNSNTLPEVWDEICRQTLQSIGANELAYEDATPFLYLKELSQGFRTNTLIRHVIVDEVQDYSPFQLEFMRRLFPRAKMTVLGDLNQAIYAQGEVLGDLAGLVSIYGEENTEVISLTRSYRSTYEIVEFTRAMIPGESGSFLSTAAGKRHSLPLSKVSRSCLPRSSRIFLISMRRAITMWQSSAKRRRRAHVYMPGCKTGCR